jgi:hypothetical protein
MGQRSKLTDLRAESSAAVSTLTGHRAAQSFEARRATVLDNIQDGAQSFWRERPEHGGRNGKARLAIEYEGAISASTCA